MNYLLRIFWDAERSSPDTDKSQFDDEFNCCVKDTTDGDRLDLSVKDLKRVKWNKLDKID